MKEAFSGFTRFENVVNIDPTKLILHEIEREIEDKFKENEFDKMLKELRDNDVELKSADRHIVAEVKKLDKDLSSVATLLKRTKDEAEKRISEEKISKDGDIGRVSQDVAKVTKEMDRLSGDVTKGFSRFSQLFKAYNVISTKLREVQGFSAESSKIKLDIMELRAYKDDFQSITSELDGALNDLTARMDAYGELANILKNYDGDQKEFELRIKKSLEDMRPTYVPQLQKGADGTVWHDDSGVPNQGLGINNDYYLDSSTSNYYKKIDGRWVSRGTLSGGGSLEVEDEGSSLTTAVTKMNFVGAGVAVTEPVADEVTVTISGASVSFFRDSSAGGGTYGLITGSGTGPYTVSNGSYTTGTLKVYWNGQLQTQDGAGFTETTPASGTFTMDFDPTGGLFVEYQG